MAGVWVIVDEDGRGHAVRQAVGAQARLLAVSDPFSARRALAAEPVAGLIVCVGKRTLSLRSLCGHVRRELPALPIIAVRHPSFPDDRELIAVVTDVIDDGDPQDVTDNLARVTDAFEAGEATAILPPRQMPQAARPAPAPPPAAPTKAAPAKAATAAPAPPMKAATTPTPPTAPPAPKQTPPMPPKSPAPAPWAALSATVSVGESFPPVVIGALEAEPVVRALEPPVQQLRIPVAPPPRPIVMPSLPKPIVPTPTVAAASLLDPLGIPTERVQLPFVAVPTLHHTTAARSTEPGGDVAVDDALDGDTEEPTETTAITGGPNLSQVETTETHVGLSVGSSVESEEAREDIAGSGAEVLMQIAAGRRTGRLLVIDGEGAGTLHWSAGAPVGAELPTGDGGLYRRLVSSGLVVPAQAPPIVRQGRLLVALVEAGQLAEGQRLEFERGVLRDQVLALSRQGQVHAVFVSTQVSTRVSTQVPATPTSTPINVFGLILEARRRSVAPEVIAALADEIATWRITGTSLLAKASHLVAPFAGGRDLAALATDTSARQLTLALDWDRSMGTLLLLALRDAGLILASDARPTAATTTAPTSAGPRLTNPMGMSPRQLLGVGMAPEEDDIEAAYSGHVARIDGDLLRARNTGERDALLALRERYDVARQALRLQLGFATSTGTNPF